MDRDFTYADWCALADESAIERVVVVQAAHGKDESRRLLRLASECPRIAGVVAWADLADAALPDWIDECQSHEKFAGFRPLPVSTFGADWLADPIALRGLGLLSERRVVFDLLVTWRHLGAAARVAANHPLLSIVLNHCGRPDTMTGNLEPWASDLREVARLPNVVVKCSGLVERAGIEWSVSALRPYVETVVSAFGPSRVMFATNWPVLEISGNYAGWTEAFRSICNELRLAPADVERMFEGTARRVYSLSDP